ncbi:MAG: Na+/H+ antiporter NhaC family protein [Tannerella sp.]|jgi:Na+/H+ antiporter NhaC|nr:Na+/H+ antiporter NhaC family protein [Tannerella sp.]
MHNDSNSGPRPSGKALFPLCVFFLLYVCAFCFTGDLSNMPVSVAFLAASAVAVISSKRRNMMQRINIFCRGSANNTILLMIVIFILAGAFSGTANQTGAVKATVDMLLYLLPEEIVLAGIFVAACFISIAMGTSCGTIAALTPIAVGISAKTGLDLPMLAGAVVGGSMFGDNLSFISDTTIVATRTQNVEMKDKFRANFRLVMPVAVMVLLVYIVQGFTDPYRNEEAAARIEWLKVLPYLVVLITALFGVNVITVLSTGIALSGIIGLVTNSFSVWEWCSAMSEGIVVDMGELIIVSLLAGGMFEMIRTNGGISWLITKLTRNIHNRKQAEAAIAGLVSFTDLCTANNTIALLITGPIAKQTGDPFKMDPKRTASLIDTVSCVIQSILPYGAQLLIAAGLASVNPVEIIPYLYYPFLLGIAVIISILLPVKDRIPPTPSQSRPSDRVCD